MSERIQIEAHCPIEEMAKIFNMNKELKPRQKSERELWVYTNEGEGEPHMHIRRTGKSDVCVKFYSAEYFLHGSKTDKLNSSEKEWLNDMLKLKLSSKLTYWEFAINAWNAANVIHEDKLIPEDLKQPDYTKLK